MIEECLDSLRPQADDKGLRLYCVPSVSCPTKFVGDPSRLRQILVNLVGNAIKFTLRGQVYVEYELTRVTERQVVLRVAVHDTGIGIPEHRVLGIFAKFTQVDASTTCRFGGTGLGLAISQELVELMGGQIGVTSQLGKGSEFWFTVSLSPDPRATVAATSQSPRQGALQERRVSGAPKLTASRDDTGAPGGEIKTRNAILLVEDNVTNQLVAEGLLSRMGMSVDVAGNGRAALQALRQRPYGLVLMDVQMPEMDGLEATRLIRSREAGALDPNVPIVAMTAHVMTEDRQRCLDAGMNGYVSKPITAQKLRETLAHWQLESTDPREQRRFSSTSFPKVSLPAFDSDVLLKRIDGDTRLLSKLLVAFLGDLPRKLDRLEARLAEADASGGAMEAHGIQGAAGTIAAAPFRAVALEIESFCRSAEVERARESFTALRSEFDVLKAALDEYLKGNAPQA
ncbi:MAG: ATP-binding protein [Polyangiaceae bacterium]